MTDRYSRQKLFKPIGAHGQEKIRSKHALVVGAGALGAGACEMLVRSGVGKVTIIDRDYVEWSNLQRQQLYTEEDARLRMPKAVAACQRLKQINSEVNLTPVVADFFGVDISAVIQGVNVIIDATDNFETRMYINDISQMYNIPWIYGGCVGSTGITYTIIPGETPCFECLMGKVPFNGDTCDTVGVIGPVVQWVCSQQVTEALKILVEDFTSLRSTLLFTDLWDNEWSSIKVNTLKREDCPSCGRHPVYPYLNVNRNTRTTVLCGRDTVQIRPGKEFHIDFEQLKKQFQHTNQQVEANDFLINIYLNDKRLVVFRDGRALIHGTKNEQEAKNIYQQWVLPVINNGI
ncbi:MoeB/ThiF family adenylyltransferase [Scopulibacillus cellulosilyticus]|uniref:MoeB/ThiF family adenylyltransferase n=1 Tax=Scopulibacillus cellulosilyticus TaxID=2665665 RepID=A0ABW2PYF0_9BACL